ncbi:hypothetical protein [Aquamicrobium defluvii]|uniref:Uncharacterized protein n=1 Tax=Aquamicrobium defluvii TaxID=69279 RepID=A0A011U792_9HYPH|nr:hypothetical protein [Aquamicrobium defluvii]EXL01753.1 hypothetical protein BG36_16995 [Aquamicrobium defluvii]EZQ12818.1 hypothetical protein CF98_34100 [Halopseudomonas bauzanensis]
MTEQRGELFDLLRRNGWCAIGDAPVHVGNVGGEFVTVQLQANQPLPHAGLIGIHEPLFDQREQARDGRFGFLVILPHAVDPLRLPIEAFAV